MYRYGVHLAANLSGFFFFGHINLRCASLYNEGLYFLGLFLRGNSLRVLFRQHPLGKPLAFDWFESLLIYISLVAR